MSKLIILAVLAAVVVITSAKPQRQGAAASNIIDAYTEDVFNEDVLNSPKPVVVFFGNDECSSCKWIYPQLERLAKNRSERLALAKVAGDKLPTLADDYGVSTYPTVMTMYNGEIIEMTEGSQWSKIVGLVNNAGKL